MENAFLNEKIKQMIFENFRPSKTSMPVDKIFDYLVLKHFFEDIPRENLDNEITPILKEILPHICLSDEQNNFFLEVIFKVNLLFFK